MGDQPTSNSMIELQGDEFWPLSEKPFFEVVITKANVKPSYQMVIPAKFQQTLPSCSIPTVLTFGGKNWEMTYTHGSGQRKFDTNWREFVNDNNLKVGDACVFELLECSSTKLVFRVQILRGDIPSELLGKLKDLVKDATSVYC
ncbi:B3 domain-containing protein Os04g0386900 isoform X2 [Pyrus x bretschneideri]|uniref:B3 domain-containing protein Os04g0386900 isoform X2 n=1 Tax=Pyrus x bretschneideri TaxID=225117 RepID=UPI00202F2149|nr:B3 domain-containing protein Os04g0386900 isoform X2 [Pyrus x bretschneideri]